MKKYLITNPKFEGEVTALYSEHDLLMKVDFSATDMNAEMIDGFKKIIPANCTGIETAFNSNTVVVALQVEISFDHFWEKYNHKYNRLRCEKIWDRLSKTEKTLAYMCIDKYEKHLRKSEQYKKHPDTWLKNKSWNEYK